MAHAVTSGTFPIKDITQFKTMYLAFFYSGTYFLTELNPHIMLFNDSFIGKNLEFGRVGTNTGYSIGGSVRFASTTSFVMGNWTVNYRLISDSNPIHGILCASNITIR